MKFREVIKNGVNRMAETLDVFRKDVFELQGVPAFQQFYDLYMWRWKAVYKGYFPEWHLIKEKTVEHPYGLDRRMATLNAGKLACSQLARYEWSERCEVNVSRSGEDDDPLNRYIHEVLHKNGFFDAFGELIEKTNALGGGAIKEWVHVPKDKNGNDVGDPEVRISFHMADQFVPTAWSNKKISEGLFISREAKDGYYYSVLEWHKWDGSAYRVTNDLYRIGIKDAESQSILGWWYPLNLIYPLLSPDTEIKGITKTLFQYIRPFGANFADDNSPLGVSIYSTALDTLHSLDIAFDSFQREFKLGKKRIIVPSRAIRTVADPQTGRMVRYFDSNDSVYEALATDDENANKIIDNSVELRVEEHISAINALLSILCMQIGLNAGALAFDTASGLKTATEVVSENSKTYGTVKACTQILQTAIEDMVDAIIELAVAYGVTFEGQSIQSLVAGGYSKSVKFDDSIVQDRASDIAEGIQLVTNGLMSRKKFLTAIMGLTDEQAEVELKRINDESRVGDMDLADMMFGADGA